MTETNSTIWFDVRLLPVQHRTLSIIREWVRVLDWALKHTGLNHDEDVQGDPVSRKFPYQGSSIDFFQAVNDGKDWEAFLKARRLCDRSGVPYWLFCDTMIRTLLGMDEVVFDISEINSMIVSSSIMVAVRERMNSGPIVFARHPFFKAANYAGDPMQDEYAQYVTEKVKCRYKGKWKGIIARMVAEGKLNAEAAKKAAYSDPGALIACSNAQTPCPAQSSL